MLTRNFYEFLLNQICNKGFNLYYLTGVDGAEVTVSSITGNTNYGALLDGAMTKLNLGTNFNNQFYGVVIGTGTTAPTLDDIFIENQITTGLSVANPDRAYVSRTDEAISMSATYTLKNTTGADITITEIGLVLNKQTASGTTTNAQHTLLVDRTVLSNPVTVPAGETKNLVYTVKFTYPTA